MKQQSLIMRLTDAAIYTLTGVLLWLCTKPLLELTILNSRILLILFVIVMLLMFYLNIPIWISLSVCALLNLYAMHFYFFYNDPLFSAGWLVRLAEGIAGNVNSLLYNEPAGMTDLFSAFLFFILFSLIMFAVRFWLLRGKLMLFVALAALSCALLDTFTVYDGSRSIVVFAATALLMLILRRWQQFVSDSSGTVLWKSSLYWFSTAALAIAVILVSASIIPKPDSQWSVPSNLSGLNFALFKNGSFFSGNQRIGYDDDDSQLGGSLTMDQTPLFTAAVNGNPDYWRVSHKDRYTGHGWINSERRFVPVPANGNITSMLSLYERETKTKNLTAILRFSSDSPAILPYNGEPRTVSVPGKRLKIEQPDGQILTENEDETSSERLIYAEPTYQTSALSQPSPERDPESIRASYLQLPEELPERVRALGLRLTAGYGNRYDRVRAIVDYLQSSRFSYSTDQISRPSRNQDYVDQFLFESRVGYCDNFSTAMVVLLRSAGIPARWVKGFTTGEYQGQVWERVNGKGQSLNQFQITNADAHSWGEVYFHGSGWVPFEPTPSFSDPSQFAADPLNNNNGSNTKPGNSVSNSRSGNSVVPPQSTRQAGQRENQAKNQHSVNDKKSAAAHKDGSRFTINWLRVFQVTIIILAIDTFAVFLTRGKWLRLLYRKRLARNSLKNNDDFQRAYRVLFQILRLDGIIRSDSETLREFANRVDRVKSGNAMLILTEQYERLIYMKEPLYASQDAERAHLCICRLVGEPSNTPHEGSFLNLKP